MNAETIKATLPRDLMASVVVFLVALPLCMGIAIASGLPPAKGVITGIVGGLVVGWLAGAPLQVSGPAAGLTVLVFELVQQYGAAMLGPILLLAGALQLLAGRLKLGCWFRVTAPAVVYGMLAGIGILIVLSQLHVMMDAQPEASGLDNLGAFPAALWAALPLSGGNGMAAASLGLLTIACMWTWDRLRPQRLRLLPGALLGVAAATLVGLWLGLDVRRVEVPDNLADAISWLQPADLLAFADPGLLVAALAVAFIASAETLLSAAAVDRMHQGPRADFDRELTAQGVGNMLCGVLGALPMTGVIVRSSANVQAGARTRLSAMLHALWLLAAVVLLAALLEQIPVASLAGVLVYTGLKLIDLDALRQLGRYGRMAMLIHVATALTIVATDLLTGVLLG
ncbi:MAG TPA: SulP family inorganic anion transporter, partial [Pseudomonas sp.]|nr:SulP family inorganic anion transporter [Pseudomonas sp.]